METETRENNNPGPAPSNLPVLNISGKVEPKQSHPRIRGKKMAAPVAPLPKTVIPLPPKIDPTTFPVISSRILLKTDVPPAVPKLNPSDLDQYLCFLWMVKLASRKRVYHMYLSNKKDLERDSERIRKTYENRKDIQVGDRMIYVALCARSLCHRVQNKLTDVAWNTQKSVFETDGIGELEVRNISARIEECQNEDMAKLFNYIKFLSATNT